MKANQDRLLRPGAGREFLEGIENVLQIALDGPHLLLQARTDRCAEEIARFAASIKNAMP